jgi:alcohol dehydrogenase (cytochrome c)
VRRVNFLLMRPPCQRIGESGTAGGLVFAGDMGATRYAFDAKTGDTPWSPKIGGALGGGVITYRHNDLESR